VAPCSDAAAPPVGPGLFTGALPEPQPCRRAIAPDEEEAGFCDRTVVSGLGAVMAQLAADSDIGGGADTPFHRSRPASVPIAAYVALMRWHYACSLECFVIAFVYLGRALDSEPRLAVGPLTCHRLAAACLTLAVKWQDDDTMSNADYSKVCGMTLQELNSVEKTLLQVLRHNLAISTEEFDLHRRALYRAAAGDLSVADMLRRSPRRIGARA